MSQDIHLHTFHNKNSLDHAAKKGHDCIQASQKDMAACRKERKHAASTFTVGQILVSYQWIHHGRVIVVEDGSVIVQFIDDKNKDIDGNTACFNPVLLANIATVVKGML